MVKEEISILMCIYKKDDPYYFSAALESIECQSKFFEELILVINGYLTIKHYEAIKLYEKKFKIRKVFLKKNIGLAAALNIGLDKIKTNWIARFDSDDICDENRFRELKKLILKYGNKIDVFGTYMKEFEHSLNDHHKIRFVPLSNKAIKKRIIISNPINHISVVFKKELVDKYRNNNGEFYPVINGFEDYALWIKLIRNEVRFQNFPKVLVFARVGSDMLRRRGGIKYIYNELKFRFFILKYLNSLEKIFSFMISLVRIILFSMPISLKRIFYLMVRNIL